MPKGRPTYSKIRQNIIEILYVLGKGYGYEIYKAYKNIFPPVTMRSIYYHLKKGVSLGEFKVLKIQQEKGEYSWGDTVEKTYYSLGDKATASLNIRVKEYFSKNK